MFDQARQALSARRLAGAGKLAPHRDFLVAQVKTEPDITVPELAARLLQQHGVTVCPQSLSRFLINADLRYKRTLVASERDLNVPMGKPGVKQMPFRAASLVYVPGGAGVMTT